MKKFPNVSIVVATYNGGQTLIRVLRGMLRLDYPARYEVIVVNDGSKDNTAELVEDFLKSNKKAKKLIKFINFRKNKGVTKARNAGIKKARYEIVVNMDHDCIPYKNWLREMVKPFADPKVGVVSGYGGYGGTSTAFRRKLLLKVGGYDEDYFYFREDTDLTFKIMELGYKFVKIKPLYIHDHKEIIPKGILQILKYVWKRLKYHENDVLLYKKHPKLAAEFLRVKFGFLIDPAEDFKRATGLWHSKGKLALSSPRGIVFIENKSPLHALIIVLLGILYVIAVKLIRLKASLKFGKLLI
ncbi:MAG: glycosyltransferase family 2 protein [Candidatus Diapherotrites archaeon]|nr:glycosyltransferase family 2 protein [Candidatus Diapherotrites archaeon]